MHSIKLFLVTLFFALPVAAQDRHALVVGINTYAELPSLERAVNDATAVAGTLERAGFSVRVGVDLDRRGFSRLLSEFVADLEPDDEAVVFYAGHAVAIDNENYLVPADAGATGGETQIISESISQEFMLEQIVQTGVRLSVVILDACRNNPFEGLTSRSVGRTRGLAVEQPPQGVFLMFSADVGQAALDGLGRDDTHPNSVFTRILVPLLEQPGLDIVDVARQLRGEVEALAASVGHQQFPVYRDRMRGGGRFYLYPAAAEAGAGCAAAAAEWETLRRTEDVDALTAYLERHARCETQALLARLRLQGLLEREDPYQTTASTAPQSGRVEVFPFRARVGDELSVRIETPAGCNPFLFNISADDQFTQLPLDLFERSVFDDGRESFINDENSRFGLVVTEDDAPGEAVLGFLCQPVGLGPDDARTLVRAVRLAVDERSGGMIESAFGAVAFNTAGYEVLE